MAATTALKNAILALVTTGHFVGLISAVTDEAAGNVTELSNAGYARQAITWGTISGGAMSNSLLILFPATSGSATYRYLGIYSAATGGVLKHVVDLGSNRTYDSVNQPQIAVGGLVYDANRIST